MKVSFLWRILSRGMILYQLKFKKSYTKKKKKKSYTDCSVGNRLEVWQVLKLDFFRERANRAQGSSLSRVPLSALGGGIHRTWIWDRGGRGRVKAASWVVSQNSCADGESHGGAIVGRQTSWLTICTEAWDASLIIQVELVRQAEGSKNVELRGEVRDGDKKRFINVQLFKALEPDETT